MNDGMAAAASDSTSPHSGHVRLLRWGFALAAATVIWNVIEGIIAVMAGSMAGSVALFGFGVDSFIESASGIVVGWRFWTELHVRSLARVETTERRAARMAGGLLLILALYILYDAGRRLLGFGKEPAESVLGIVLTVVSLVLMPVLASAKFSVAARLDSRAFRTDAYETLTCAWLSLTTLAGLGLNATLGWWWADPAAALMMLPLIVHEGLEGWKGGCNESPAKACGNGK